MKTIQIQLVNEKVPDMGDTAKKIDDDSGEESEGHDVIFKVKLEKPEPVGVKISKKNVCLVTILGKDDAG